MNEEREALKKALGKAAAPQSVEASEPAGMVLGNLYQEKRDFGGVGGLESAIQAISIQGYAGSQDVRSGQASLF